MDGVVGDQDVQPSVVVDIDRGQSHRLAERHTGVRIADPDPRRLADIGERPVGLPVIEIAERSAERPRRSVRPLLAVEREELTQIGVAVPRDVIANEQVQPAVVVIIEEPARRPPRVVGPGHSRRFGDVRPPVVAVVAIQPVRTDGADEQIDVSVVVIISDGRPHPVDDLVADRRIDFAERERPVAAIQTTLRTRVPRRVVPFPRPAVDQEQIEVPIAVEVRHRDAAAHRLRQQFFPGLARVVHKVHAGGGGRHRRQRDLRQLGRHLPGGRKHDLGLRIDLFGLVQVQIDQPPDHGDPQRHQDDQRPPQRQRDDLVVLNVVVGFVSHSKHTLGVNFHTQNSPPKDLKAGPLGWTIRTVAGMFVRSGSRQRSDPRCIAALARSATVDAEGQPSPPPL